MIDAVGVNYAFSEDFTKRQLVNVITSNQQNVLPSKCEDNLELGIKDKAQVWGHKGFVQGSYFETRLQQTWDTLDQHKLSLGMNSLVFFLALP